MPRRSQPPTANAGSDISRVMQPSPITLDGSAGSDPENGALDFQWQVSEQPPESDVELSRPTEAMTEFQPAVTGEYVFELAVTDPEGLSSIDSVTVTLTNNPPSASVAAFDQHPILGTAVTMDASASSDPDGHALPFFWRLTDRPARSHMPLSYEGPTLNLLFDHHGTFLLELEVSDGCDTAIVTLDPIEVVPYTQFELTHVTTDAVFDPIGERIISVGDAFLAIIGIDGSQTVLELPTTANAVAVSPDGSRAAVAHDAWVSHVDLESVAVLAAHAVPANLGDVVLDGHGNAYCYPANYSSEIYAVAMATDTRQRLDKHTGFSARAKLHPSGRKMYEATWHEMRKHLIDPAGIRPYYEFSYLHADESPRGDFWFGFNGHRSQERWGRAKKKPADSPAATSRWPANSLPLSAVKARASAETGPRHARTAPPTAAAVLRSTRRRNTNFERRSTIDTSAPRPDDRVQLPAAHALLGLRRRTL